MARKMIRTALPTFGRALAGLALLGLGAALAPAARAADPTSDGVSGWTGQVTPYVWATGLGGDIRPITGAPTLSFDSSFSEVLKDLDGAFFLSAYARRDRLVLMGDLSWSSSSRAGHLPTGLPAEAKLRQRSVTLLAGWRAIEGEVGGGRATLDVLGGLRAWSIRSEVSLAGGMLRAERDKDFIDPILALRANLALAPRWSLILYADYGGFGVGSESTSQILATLNHQLGDDIWVSGGYRALRVDYRSGGTLADVTMAGPLLGVSWRF